MLRRLPGICLVALVVVTTSMAKPPDLPDNPPVIVKPQTNNCPSLPPSALLAPEPIAVFPPAPPEEDVLITSPAGQQLLRLAILAQVHPFLALFPSEPMLALVGTEEEAEAKPCICPYQAAKRATPTPAQEKSTRTVLENLRALEKAAEGVRLAKKLLEEGLVDEARKCLEKVRGLVPGSSYDQRVKMVLAQWTGKAGDVEECEQAPQTDALPWCAPCQLGMCWMYQLREHCERIFGQPMTRLEEPLSLDCQGVPLSWVLEQLSEATGMVVVVQADVCLQQPVWLRVQRVPARLVLEMLVRPMGLEPCIRGNIVCLCKAEASCACGNKCESKCAKKCCDQCCCVKAGASEECEETTCGKCAKLHAEQVQKQKARGAGVKEQVVGLMKACYLAIHEERYEKAAELARQAHALDAAHVEGDPLVYKFHLLGGEKPTRECCPKVCPQGAARCPASCPSASTQPRQKPEVKNCPGCPVDAKVAGTVRVIGSSTKTKGCPGLVGQILVVGNEQTGKTVLVRQVQIQSGQVVSTPCGAPTCCEKKGSCCKAGCGTEVGGQKVRVQVKVTGTGSLLCGKGVSRSAGVIGSVVRSEDGGTKKKGSGGDEECQEHGALCLPLVARWHLNPKAMQQVGKVLLGMCCTPAIPQLEANQGCLTLGLSTSGGINLFTRTKPMGGVVYHVMIKDGIFLMWMTPSPQGE